MTATSEWPDRGLADLATRRVVTAKGRIRHIEVSPHDAPARLTVRVANDEGALDCVFLGRRVIAGLEPGAIVCVEGRVTEGDAVPVIFNPRYELCQA
jgi:RecG-like helicase